MLARPRCGSHRQPGLPEAFLLGLVQAECPRRAFRSCLCRYSSASSAAPPARVAKATERKGIPALRLLQRPLGVKDPPSTYEKSWRERALELMDQDVRLERRRQIIKEATKGYYTDLNATRIHGGKTWVAPSTLISKKHALYFPDIVGAPLNSKANVHTTDLCRGRISVIAILSTVVSEEHVLSFVQSTNKAFLPNANYRFIQINLQENILKGYLVSLYLSSLRRKIPQLLHPTYLLSTQNMDYVREPLGMENKHIGFVYLLDEECRVRWAGGGLAEPRESMSLRACVKVLLDRLESKPTTGEDSASQTSDSATSSPTS